jgi:beta-lactamase class C
MPLHRSFLPLFLCALLSSAPLHAQTPAPTHALFDSEIRRIVGEAEIPGAAYAIVVDGQVETASGIGVRAAGGSEPVGPDTVFRIASVSKTFAAQLAAMLVEEGRLDWQRPLPAFAPELRLKDDAQARIQLQHVIGQSSGLLPNAFDNLLDANQPLAQILPHFRTLAPGCPPGQCYGYQNILYGLSVNAIEQAGGRDYASLLGERVFTPLGMRHASVGMAAFLAEADSAQPHVKRAGQWRRVEVEASYYQLPAAAGVNASANDLAIWLIAQMGGHPDVVRPATVAQLTTPRVATAKDLRRSYWKDQLSAAHYGLGWRIYRVGDEPIILHAGWVKGYVAEISYSPRLRTGLVVLLNAESSALSEIGSQFWRRELAAFPAPGAVPAVARTEPAKPVDASSRATKQAAIKATPKRAAAKAGAGTARARVGR